jgi:sulfonate transport system substrate-binding protein
MLMRKDWFGTVSVPLKLGVFHQPEVYSMRKTLLGSLAALLIAVPAFLPTASFAADKLVRIGYQKSSALFTILKSNGTLEVGLKSLGYKVSWAEFTSGLPLLEALNVGAIDISADVADTVPVFAQAAGAKLTYIAQEAPSPSAQAIVVPEGSPITKVADLKGKKVAVTKAAGVHYLLIATLEKAGLTFKDIEPAYLTPSDARAAFENGSVAAWVTWDPFLAAVQQQAKARILADGKGIADYQRYYLAGNTFADANPQVIAFIFDALQKTGQWVKQNPEEAAQALAPLWGLDAAVVAKANERRSYNVRQVVAAKLGEQQRIADVFHAAGLLPKPVKTTEVAIWKPGS